ncbi:Transcription initiation factor TFIID subunit A [Musa troglodytarum]|uniref:Transcription initiation factor TFIID subunit A n=1 Tax=Musa troglodytarum TaxID=320322 RepID=A0A9E7KIM1_9LILI|nr:Transcription initiation factor TFIID subunit A [Musa troglodytarum]
MRNWGFGKGTLKGPFGGTTEDRAVYTCRCFDRSDALRFWIVQLHRFLVTATLSLAVACSSAGVTVLFVKDVNFCSKFLLLCFDDDQQSLPGLITASFLLQNHLSVPEHVEKLVAGAGAGGDVEKPLIPEDDRSPLESLSSRTYGCWEACGILLKGKEGEGKHNSGNHTLPAEQAIHRPTQQQDRGIGLDATRSRRRGADQLSLDDRQHRFALYNKATREMVGFSCRCEGCMLSGSRRENPSHPFPCRFAPKSPVSPLRLASSSPSTHLRRFDAAEVFLGGETDRERK